MQRMKKLGKGPDEVDSNQFHFPDEDGKSDLQLADEIGDFFANISANFEPHTVAFDYEPLDSVISDTILNV